ncbi:MAG: GNAT family N-acetyltransferase [Vallitalea sp.]|jgi:ribosomal protein S18 acetylase RimI-like enzyme|nr:GNAT family N-acetyltransferase [Vallitalea sp.]
MIYNYLELNKSQLEQYNEFINRNKIHKVSMEDMDKELKCKEFDYGRGVLVKTQEGLIIGTTTIILLECNTKGIAYIIKSDIDESIDNKTRVLWEIIKEAKNIGRNNGANEIFLGTKEDSIFDILKINKQYSAIRMILEDRTIKYSPLDLVKLSEENKKEYLNIYNDAFEEVPHGATLTENEVDEYISKANENYHYIVKGNNENIGFIKLYIKDGVGEFDIGLIKSARRKGYGKLLLETAIGLLNDNKVKEIGLIVITKNTIAYNMYAKRGFTQSKVTSNWFQLD